jgi:hypothetical protein
MAQRATIDGVGWILSMLFFDLLLCHFHRYGSFRFLYVFSLAKVKRLVAMPSTGRKLPISEKFGKARAFSFGTRHKTKSKFYPKFLGEGHPNSLSLKMARKRTKSETKSMTENLLKQRLS